MQQVEVVGIEAVRTGPAAGAVAEELAVADDQRPLHVVVGEDAVLVVDETHVLHGEIPGFHAQAGAVAVGHAGARQRQVADGDVLAIGEEQSLAVAGLVGDHRVLGLAGALDDQLVGLPDRAVEIFARRDQDMVAILGGGGGLGWLLHRLVRPDFQRGGARRDGQTEQRQQPEKQPAAKTESTIGTGHVGSTARGRTEYRVARAGVEKIVGIADFAAVRSGSGSPSRRRTVAPLCKCFRSWECSRGMGSFWLNGSHHPYQTVRPRRRGRSLASA